jgi:hypothetical protein
VLDITKDIQSLTTFRRRSGDFMKLLRKSKRPVVLTVKGLEDSRRRRVRPARRFFDEFESRRGIRR